MGHQSANGAVDWRAGFTAGRLVLLLAVFVFASYPEVLLGTHSFFYRDFGLFTYPVAWHFRASVAQGELPLWNPLNNCGIPFLAQWNTSVCYPPSLLYVLLPLPWSLNYFCLGHLLLAGWAMWRLAARWTGDGWAASVAGVLYALNGLAFNNLMWTSNLAAMSWLPLVVLTVERAWLAGGRSIVVAALVSAMQVLAGAPEFVLVSGGLLLTLWLGAAWRRAVPLPQLLGRTAAVGLLVAGLTAVQILPFLELFRHSSRYGAAPGGAWSLPVWGWANFFVPLFRSSPSLLGVYSQPEQQWTSSYYVSIGAMALAGWACWRAHTPRVAWLAAVAVAGVLLAMGPHWPVNSWLEVVLPPLRWVRYPVKYILATVFALPLLAAFAVRAWPEPSGQGAGRSLRTLAWSGVVVSAVVLGVALFARAHPGQEENVAVTARNAALRGVWLWACLGLFAVLAGPAGPRARPWLALGLLVVLGMDALAHAPRLQPTVPVSACGPVEPPMARPPAFGTNRAMLSPPMQALLGQLSTPNPVHFYLGVRRALYDNCNLLNTIPKVNGFYSLYVRWEADVRTRLYGGTNVPAGLADFLGVSHVSSDTALFEWETRPTHLPLVTGGQRPVFAGPQATLEAMFAAGFDPRHVVYLPLEAREAVQVTNAASPSITLRLARAHRLEFDVRSALATWVVIAQTDYPGWRASVDGQSTRLWRANHAYQALEVPAGSHTVALVYRDSAFVLGALASLVALVACSLIAWRPAGRRADSC